MENENTHKAKSTNKNLDVNKSLFKIEKIKDNNYNINNEIINNINNTGITTQQSENIHQNNFPKIPIDTSDLMEEEIANRVRNNSFHSEFILFRRTLQLKKIYRKTRIDSLLKKCKSKVFKAIQEAINVLTGISVGKEHRLPQSFITNINIEYNKKFLNKTLEEIYRDTKVFKSSEELINSNLKMSEEDKTYLNFLLKMTHRDSYEAYIKSQRYKEDYHYIKHREGEKYAILFDYVAKVYVRYFLQGRGNQKRNPRKSDVLRKECLKRDFNESNFSFEGEEIDFEEGEEIVGDIINNRENNYFSNNFNKRNYHIFNKNNNNDTVINVNNEKPFHNNRIRMKLKKKLVFITY